MPYCLPGSRVPYARKKMKKDLLEYEQVRDLLISRISPVGTETVPLALSAWRVLAQPLVAADNVPSFDRSPYDGYALRSADTAGIDGDHPVTLEILEEIPAGHQGSRKVTYGTAVKIITGAPLPEGADAIVPFERTRFTAETVTLFTPLAPGSNVVRAGEDVKAGTVLSDKGALIDSGLLAVLAAQNISSPEVYRVPRVGLISTGSELIEPGNPAEPGKIYNTNRYSLTAALLRDGAEAVSIGSAADDAGAIASLIRDGLASCDALILSGGVSVGDYDLTPDAMERCGTKILVRGAAVKPGMACCYGMADQKPVMALSGNPASAITNYYAIVQSAIKKLRGLTNYLPQTIELALDRDFEKTSKGTRLLRGKIDIVEGRAVLCLPEKQGNVVISSLIGCDAMAVVPAGSGRLSAGTVLKGFLL